MRPWYTSDGTVGGIVIFSEDISQRKNAELELRRRNQELEHFNNAATDRELRMVALKQEVNAMARAAGRPAPYDTSFADGSGATRIVTTRPLSAVLGQLILLCMAPMVLIAVWLAWQDLRKQDAASP